MDTKELLYLSEKLDSLLARVEQLSLRNQPPTPKYRSENIQDIAAALAHAQLEFKCLENTKYTIDGAYADIEDINNATAQALANHGLKLYQHTQYEGEKCVLYTEIIHTSNQWLSSRINLILSSTDKETAAHLDFHKRHQALTILGWYSSGSYDDNGQRQHEEKMIGKIKHPSKVVAERKHWITITKEQYEDVLETLRDYPQLAKDIMERYAITTLQDMPKQSFPEDMKRIRELIATIQKR